MAEIQENNLLNCCRLCLSIDGNSIALYSSDEKSTFADQIFYCFSLKLDFIEKLPNLICENCRSYLELSLTFKESIGRTDNQLRKNFPDLFILKDESQIKIESDDPLIGESNHKVANSEKKKDESTKAPEKNRKDEETEDEDEDDEEDTDNTDYDNNDDFEEDKSTQKKIRIKKKDKKKSKVKLDCPICGKKLFNIDRHITKNHGKDNREIKCEVCNKQFFSRSKLKVHSRTHSGERPFSCNYCDKKFLTQHIKTLHERSNHTGERPFQCEFCSKTFHANESLKVHIRRHQGIKPFACSACGKTFTTSSKRLLHFRIHTGEKPYQCDVCSTSFRTSSRLKRHLEIHAGVKHTCTICLKSFSRLEYLKKHERFHSGQMDYRCEICGMEFVLQGTYKNHLKSHEKSKMQQLQQTPQLQQQEQILIQTIQIEQHIPQTQYTIPVSWNENAIIKPVYIEKKESQ